MSSWHDTLVFHLRNGSFCEQNQTLLSLLALLISFLAVVLWSPADKDLQKAAEGMKQWKKAFLHFHSTVTAVKMKMGWR